MTATGGADGVRQIRRHGQCIPFGSNRSAAPHRHFAKVTGRKSGDHECRWIERDGHISLHRLRLDPGSGSEGFAPGLNEHLFANLNQARRIIDYNTNKPHTRLNGLTPTEFANRPDKGQNLNRLSL